jgi:hypothetical protein
MNTFTVKQGLLGMAAILTAVSSVGAMASGKDRDDRSVEVKMFAPVSGDHVGIGGRGWFVDLAISFDHSLEATGFTGFQLTGPAVHNNVAPFPGTFSTGVDDRLPGLIVLVDTTSGGAKSCQNIANLFNLTGVTDITDDSVELWDTWLVGAPNFGVNTVSNILVAVAADLNNDGIFNDAPAAIPDANADGVCDKRDLKAFGLASNIEKARFFINP